MNNIIEINIGIVFLYGIYMLVLRNETDFRKQRAFLVGSLLCALIFPFIEIPASFETPVGITTIMLPELSKTAGPNITSWSTEEIITVVYLSVTLLIAAPLLFHAGRLYQAMKQAPGRYRDNYYVVESNENAPSWSFFKLIYIGRSNELGDGDKDLVMKHEMLHGKLLHSADMLLITLICVVFWFNPVIWFYRRTLAKVHEFEVDELVAKQSGPAEYSELLVKTALTGNGFLLAHHFNQSFILKRINMINMIKNRVSNWKFVVLVCAVAVYFVGVACTEQMDQAANSSIKDAPAEAVAQLNRLKDKYPDAKFELKQVNFYKPAADMDGQAVIMIFSTPEKEKSWIITENSGRTNEVYVMADQTAEPPLGIEAFYSQLSQVIKYPEESSLKGIEGKVFVEFVVNKDGSLSDVKVVKGVNEELNTEAMRAVMQLGKWKPAKHKGEALAQRMVLPITFKLK